MDENTRLALALFTQLTPEEKAAFLEKWTRKVAEMEAERAKAKEADYGKYIVMDAAGEMGQ